MSTLQDHAKQFNDACREFGREVLAAFDPLLQWIIRRLS